MQKELKYE